MEKHAQARTVRELTDAELATVAGGSVIEGIKGAVSAAADAVVGAAVRIENMICPLCRQH
jgi:hypothetical protein